MRAEKSETYTGRTIPVKSWGQFVDLVTEDTYKNWVFRGQEKASWPLQSTLSRYLLRNGIHRSVWSHQEERILRVFRRKAHHFLQHVPDEQDSFQWLALMQHHGAPTRLLDLTWSPYVAAFFALERAEGDAAVWAMCVSKIRSAGFRLEQQSGIQEGTGPRVPGNFEKYFLPGNRPLIHIGEPVAMNRRLIAQSGTFVMPGVLDRPVEAILAGFPEPDSLLVKFVLSRDGMRDQAMRELYNMNLTHATLFPDLDGLARSMAYELEYHWAFDPRTGEAYPGYRWFETEAGERWPVDE